jgi:hypothetical protein
VDETFNVPGTGLVLGGTLMRFVCRKLLFEAFK